MKKVITIIGASTLAFGISCSKSGMQTQTESMNNSTASQSNNAKGIGSAIPGDGMNPVWREVQIVFNPGFTAHQLFSDNEVLADASGPNPEITLDTTNEVYWCPIVGAK